MDTLWVKDVLALEGRRKMTIYEVCKTMGEIESVLVALGLFSSVIGTLVMLFTIYNIYLILVGKTSTD